MTFLVAKDVVSWAFVTGARTTPILLARNCFTATDTFEMRT